VNPSTLEDEFITLVQHIEYKLFKRNNKKFETQWWQNHKKKDCIIFVEQNA
jgi:hypothetical protein